MTEPTLKDQLTTLLVDDRDLVFSIPLERKVRCERRHTLLATFLWRAALVALIGLAATAACVGLVYLARLTIAAISTG